MTGYSFSFCEWQVTQFIARQISALSSSLAVYREDEVVVLSGTGDNFGVEMERGNSFVLGLVKGDFNVLFHT